MLCLICQDGMWCLSLAPQAWNLSRGGQANKDAQDAVDTGDITQNTQDNRDTDSTSSASGQNSAISDTE